MELLAPYMQYIITPGDRPGGSAGGIAGLQAPRAGR